MHILLGPCNPSLQNYTEMTVSGEMTLFVTVEKWPLGPLGLLTKLSHLKKSQEELSYILKEIM